MNFSFLSLFKKKQDEQPIVSSSKLKQIIKDVAHTYGLQVYEDITLYHQQEKISIPFLLLDNLRGLFLFESKQWSFENLNSANIEKANFQQPSDNTLSFELKQKFIKQKYNELIHNDGVNIYNFLLLDNIKEEEYQSLNDYTKELLPVNRIIFQDSNETEILKKLRDIKKSEKLLPSVDNVMGNLLVQYMIYEDENNIHLATHEQMYLIDNELKNFHILYAKAKSGKSSVLILNAIFQNLKNPNHKTTIIAPTTYACDKLKNKLINTIERAMIVIDISFIEIITPKQLINKHLKKLKKQPLCQDDILHVDDLLMNKNFQTADLIMCDDANLVPDEFINYLKHIQKNSNLLLVNHYAQSTKNHIFKKSFKKQREIILRQTNPFAKTMQIVLALLKENQPKDILIVSNDENKAKLKEDLNEFVKEKTILFDSNINLVNQNLDGIILTSYEHLGSIDEKFVILLDIDTINENQLSYVQELADEKLYFVYEKEDTNIQKIKQEQTQS